MVVVVVEGHVFFSYFLTFFFGGGCLWGRMAVRLKTNNLALTLILKIIFILVPARKENKTPMGFVDLLVVPHGIKLSSMPNGHVADVKYLVVNLRCKFISSGSFQDQPFSTQISLASLYS